MEECLEEKLYVLEKEFYTSMGLSEEDYLPIFRNLRDIWIDKVDKKNGPGYLYHISFSLKPLLKNPSDWQEIGTYLADATKKVYGNGSQQFITDAVPSLVSSGLVKTKEELRKGVELLIEVINPLGEGEHLYSKVAESIRSGEVGSLNNFKTYFESRGYINIE
ncbi:MAG: hypothetical protein AABY07_05770, partial [Nanoarchaeota archaeon]